MHEGKPRPCSFYLKPLEPEKMCGRSEFFLHGCFLNDKCDVSNPPCGDCSAGCVVCSAWLRVSSRVKDVLIVHSTEMDYYIWLFKNRNVSVEEYRKRLNE